MKIAAAHDTPKLFHLPIQVKRVEMLGQVAPEAGAPPSSLRLRALESAPAVRVDGTLYVSPFVHRLAATSAVAAPADAPAAKDAGASEPGRAADATKITLAHVTGSLAIGGSLATAPMMMLPLAKGASAAQLAGQLSAFGFAPAASDQVAASALSFARSNAGHLTCVFLAGGGIGLGVIEALKPDWSWKRKLGVAALVGAVLVGVALLLMSLGIWGGASEDRTAAPASSQKAQP